jgi:hypothetical protein
MCVEMVSGPEVRFSQTDQFTARPSDGANQWHGTFATTAKVERARIHRGDAHRLRLHAHSRRPRERQALRRRDGSQRGRKDDPVRRDAVTVK